MKIGYARVSTQDQDLGRQQDALTKYGCERMFMDKISGSKRSRPNLDKMLEVLQPGDVVVVQKLDRLGRSLRHLIHLTDSFRENGIDFVSLSDGFDTTTPTGKLMFNMVASFAEFERELIKERVNNGIAFKRSTKEYVSGEKKWGRPEVSLELRGNIIHMSLMDAMTVSEIAKELGLSRPTVYKILKSCKTLK